MTYIFVALFCVGLVAGVRVMLYGVERDRPAGDDSPRSFSASPAVIAAFSAVAGIVGYLALRFGLQPAAVWGASLGSGALAAVATSRAIRRWWVHVPEHDVDDERYVLQGSIARVVDAITPTGGTVSLTSSTETRVLPAKTIDGQNVAAGAEVVVERIEDGIAYVEDWAEVEKRL